MNKKTKNLLILAISASFIAKFIEWLLQAGLGTINILQHPFLLIAQIAFLIGSSFLVFHFIIYIGYKEHAVLFTPIVWYALKEVYNFIVVLGFNITSAPFFILSLAEALFFGFIGFIGAITLVPKAYEYITKRRMAI